MIGQSKLLQTEATSIKEITTQNNSNEKASSLYASRKCKLQFVEGEIILQIQHIYIYIYIYRGREITKSL